MAEDLTYNELRGIVELRIDGEVKELRFPQGALKRIVDELGLDGISELPAKLAAIDTDVTAICVWGGLLHAEPELALDSVSMMSWPIADAIATCVAGINLAFWGNPRGPDEAEEEAEAADDPPKGGPGTGAAPSAPPSNSSSKANSGTSRRLN